MNGANVTKSVSILLPFKTPSGNTLRREYRHPMAYARLRESFQHTIFYLVNRMDKSWLESMASLGKKMSVRITISHSKLYDADNAYSGVKPCLDALVRLKLLADDDNDHLSLTVEQEKINRDTTRISICEA